MICTPSQQGLTPRPSTPPQSPSPNPFWSPTADPRPPAKLNPEAQVATLQPVNRSSAPQRAYFIYPKPSVSSLSGSAISASEHDNRHASPFSFRDGRSALILLCLEDLCTVGFFTAVIRRLTDLYQLGWSPRLPGKLRRIINRIGEGQRYRDGFRTLVQKAGH